MTLPKTPTGHCQATSRRTHKPCGKHVNPYAIVCDVHGGEAPQVMAQTVRRRQAAVLEVAMETYGLAVETTPEQALLDEVYRTAGHISWLASKIKEFDDDQDLVWGITKDKTGGDDAGITREAKPSVWLDLYSRERAHLVRVCATAISAGIEERRVRLAESEGAQLADLIQQVLDAMNLTAEQAARIPDVVPRILRAC